MRYRVTGLLLLLELFFINPAASATVTINKASGHSDPTGTSPIMFDVVFSESVSDFTTGDVTLSGKARANTATVSGGGTTYTVTVTGMTRSGTVIAKIAAGVATNSFGIPNSASTSSDNSVEYDKDTTAPDTTINTGTPSFTKSNSATFTFSSSAGSSTFECQLDSEVYSSCTSGQTYNSLSDGSHTFSVRAIDGAGNTDPTPASQRWTVDTPPIWSPTPSDQTSQFGVSFIYDVKAKDSSTITYSIDDKTNFAINSGSGRITNATELSVSNYNLNITATDALANSISQNITVTVQAEPTYSVSGCVFNDNNAGLEGVNIQNGTNQDTSDATGYYLISGLLNGSYNFSYSRSGFNTNYSIITISGSDVTIANMTLVGIPVTVTSLPPSSGGGGGSSSGGGGGGTSGEDFTNILLKEKYDLYIYKDIVSSYKFKSTGNPILSISIVGNVNAREIPTAVEVLKNTSSLVESPAPGNVYMNVNLWVGTSGFGTPKNIKEAVIRFRIENSWLSSNNVISSGINMVRWDGSKWDPVETSEETKDITYTYFEAKTYSFSSFAITGMKPKESMTVTENTSTLYPIEYTEPSAVIQPKEKRSEYLTNWFLLIGVFFAIGIIIEMYLWMKKK